MRPELAAHSPGTGPAARELARSVRNVRTRARAMLFGSAAIAALAADVWYEIAGNALALFLRVDIYFPLFFLVAFAVLASGVFLKTQFEAFSRDLDTRFSLKERLGAAATYRTSRTIPAAVIEAQAREAAAAIDFAALRRSFRFRPYRALLALGLGTIVLGWLAWRYPDRFEPRNLMFRHGGTLMTLADLRQGGGTEKPGSRLQGAPERPAAPPRKPMTLTASTGNTQDGTQESNPDQQHGKAVPAGKKPEPPPAQQAPDPGRPAPGKSASPPPAQSNSQTSAYRDTNWSREQSRAYEETRRVSPATAKPAGGPSAPLPDLRAAVRGQPLPPLPFFRLLSGKQPADALLDPGTVTIILEAYPGKYRSHLEAFLKALQSRRELKRGS